MAMHSSPLLDSLISLSNLKDAILMLLLSLVALIGVQWLQVLQRRKTLPPGPLPWPLVGNHFQIPWSKCWIKFEQWARDYDTPMTTVWLGSRPFIVVNEAATALDLYEKKGDIYNTGPPMKEFIMGGLLSGDQLSSPMMPYNNQWRQHRRLLHTAVGVQAVKAYRTFQGHESAILLRDLVTKPAEYVASIERYAVSIVSIVGWGRRIKDNGDHVATIALAMMKNGVEPFLPRHFIIETFPWLLKLPTWLYSFPVVQRARFAHAMGFFYGLSKEGSTNQEENFSKRMIAAQTNEGMTDAEVAALTGNLIGGGVDTTSATLITFLLAMCVTPEVQKKAQAELDQVVGHSRLPTWDDEQDLPYIAMVCKEVLRWRSVAILGGLQHSPTRDEVYNGWVLPEGIAMVNNLWGIHRHEKDFPNPDNFDPLRWEDPRRKGPFAFGFGKRICSGMPLAQQSLFLAVARMLYCFNILPGLDANGQEIALDIYKYTDSENKRPQPFECRFQLRGPHVKQIILDAAEDAKEGLSIYDGTTTQRIETATPVKLPPYRY